MREFWQRRPVMIRQALPHWRAPFGRDRLFELARDPSTETRLVTRQGSKWRVQHGPFDRLSPRRTAFAWTLLVQGVDLIDDDARTLLSRFRFIADARLDDLMASYATDGGGVGPHVDSYDVFLLQASGQRRWRISRQRDLALVPGAPLQRLARFTPTAEWILEPGDMLYLPPGVAHEGVAIGECITYSIGFRAPSYRELLEPWAVDWAAHATVAGRYGDAGTGPASRPAALPPAMTERIHAALTRQRPTRSDTERFLLQALSEPKANTVFARPPVLSLQTFRQRAGRNGLRLSRKSRMLYARLDVGINGEFVRHPAGLSQLHKLADSRHLAANEAARASPQLAALLHEWHAAGWIEFDRKSA